MQRWDAIIWQETLRHDEFVSRWAENKFQVPGGRDAALRRARLEGYRRALGVRVGSTNELSMLSIDGHDGLTALEMVPDAAISAIASGVWRMMLDPFK